MAGCLSDHGYPIVGFLRSAGGYYGSNYDGANGAAHDPGVYDYCTPNDASR